MTAFDFVAEVFGDGQAAPAPGGAGRPQPAPSAPPTIPPEALAGYCAAWLLRIGSRPDIPAAGPALRVAAVIAHREAAGQDALSCRELGAHLPARTVDQGLRSLRIIGALRQEVHPADARAVAYRPVGGLRPARGALADGRRLNWLRRAAVDTDLSDLAIRLALLAGSAWPWETPQRPPEAAGLAGRLGVTPDDVVAAWAALVRTGFLRAGVGDDGRPTLRVVARAAGRGGAEGEL